MRNDDRSKRRLRGVSPRALTALTSWRPALPLSFVLISLGALLLIPLAVQQQRGRLRAERDLVIEPARERVDEIHSAVARSVAARRGYLITGDATFLDEYRAAVGAEGRARRALDPLARRLGPESSQAFDTMIATADRWHGVEADLLGALGGDAGPANVGEQQALYLSTLGAISRMRAEVMRARNTQEARILEVERLGSLASLFLLVVALSATALLGWVAQRILRLGRVEQDLRLLSHRLTGTVRLRETAEHIATAARAMTGAEGAFVAVRRPDSEVTRVLAGTGLASTLGADGGVGYERLASDSEGDDRSPRRRALDELDEPLRQALGDRCRGCRVLAAPLPLQVDAEGELVLLRRKGRFRGADVQRLSLLQDLACLALRKSLLFEEARRRRREAEELMSVRARLIRGITHDIKNPLSAADGYAELLESGIGGELNDEQRTWIQRLRRAGRSMAEIIDDLVEFSRADGAELPMRPEDVDLAALATEAAEEYQAAASAAGLSMEARAEPGLPRIATDRRRVKEILGNLLSNAVKYTPPGGTVVVRVSAARRSDDRPWIGVAVADSGPGIPRAEQERVFKEFSRLEPGRAGGSGIGLSMSRKVARLLGGDLTLASEEGEGATFTLFLPAGSTRSGAPASDPPSRHAAPARTRPPSRRGRAPRSRRR